MQKNRNNLRKKRWAMLIGILLILVVAIFGIRALLQVGQPTQVFANQLPCLSGQQVTPFGDNVLYYDGVSIHCITTGGAVRWSFQIGSGASFSAGESSIVAWVGSQIYILDQGGVTSYIENLGEMIQFARIGKRYAAAIVGDDTAPRLIIKDLTGASVDEEADAFSGKMMLDVGFYGSDGQYMWTMALDVYGTVANTVLNTFEVGQMNTGEISLGEALTYQVLYDNTMLKVISTRQLRTFDYLGAEKATASILVYGWKLVASEVPEKGEAMMLLAPTAQTTSQYNIRELRLLSGSTDRRYTLPSACVGAGIHDKILYAFSAGYIYRTEATTQRFAALAIPEGMSQITDYLGMTKSGRALLASGDVVYAVELP